MKRRVSQLSEVLSIVSLACTQARRQECFVCEAELIGLRAILGIVNRQKLTARERQRRVERLGLGLGPHAWGDNDFKWRCQSQSSERRLRRGPV